MRRYLSRDEVYPAQDPRVTARFITVNGRRLRVIEGGSPGGHPVVFIAGWASGAYQFRKNLPAVAAAGFRGLAVELPGQGESDKPKELGFYTIPTLTRELEGALDALSVESCALVGQSLGAAVAIAFSRRLPHRVRRLALLAPVGLTRVNVATVARHLVPRRLAPLMGRLAVRAWWAIGLRLAYGELDGPTSRDVDEYYAPAREPAYAASLLALVHGVDWAALRDEDLAELAMPLLVMCGSADRLIRCREVAERTGRLPNARSIVIPGAGHALQEEAPEPVNRALIDFLCP